MEKNNENGLVVKWGNELFDDGITNIPQCFARYGRKFVTPGEFSFIVGVLSFQYGSDLPFPSQETIADNMGVNVRQIRKWINSLEAKELIEVFQRQENGKRTSNGYSFKPLIDKCLEVSKDMKAAKAAKVVTKKKKPRGTSGTGRKPEVPQVPVESEPQVPVESEPQVPVESEPQVPTNKGVEKSSEEGNLKKVCIDDETMKDVLSYINSRQDFKKHTQKIYKLLDILSKYENFKIEVFMKTLEIVDLNIKPFSYLENALINNIKKGFVKTYEQDQPKNRVEKLPEWYEKYKQNNEKQNTNNSAASESVEEKRERLEKLQAQYKSRNNDKVSELS